jgi:F-type H+-transporting ATPase subunit gamma
MAAFRDIARRINSVKNTRKTTKAMEMVAAARLRRAQARIEALRPYAERVMELMQEVAKHVDSGDQYPLLKVHEEEKRVAIVMLTGDRGLAGAFNANILRHALNLHDKIRAEGKEVVWVVIGKKGVGTMRFRGFDVKESITGITDRPKFTDAEDIAHRIVTLYEAGEVDRVHLVYNHFKSPMEQVVTEEVILPLGEEVVSTMPEVSEGEQRLEGDFIFEPSANAILQDLLPSYVDNTVYRALLESTASEHGARMTAMRNASENAEEMIGKLTLAMNKARQASITQEILEVVAGAEALG